MGMKVSKPVLNADGSHVAVWHVRKKKKLDIRCIADTSPIVQIFGCRGPCSAGFGAWDQMSRPSPDPRSFELLMEIYARNADGLEMAVFTRDVPPLLVIDPYTQHINERIDTASTRGAPVSAYIQMATYYSVNVKNGWTPMTKEDLEATLGLHIPPEARIGL